MKHRYLPATEKDKQEMLATIGVNSIDDLFADIPENVKYKKEYQIKFYLILFFIFDVFRNISK